MKLDMDNPVPLHNQLKDILEKQILDGEYEEKIPSERELMDMYDVSRSTVREAVSLLVQEGILEKRHGRGTFVSHKPVEEWLKITNFTEATKNMAVQLIEHGEVSTPDNIREGTFFEDQCYHIERLRLKGETPFAIERHYYSKELGEALASYDLNAIVLYDTLEQDFNIPFWEAEQVITCGRPSKKDAKNLGVSNDMCLLITERIMTDKDNNFVEYYKGYFRSDMYSFAMKMSRKSG